MLQMLGDCNLALSGVFVMVEIALMVTTLVHNLQSVQPCKRSATRVAQVRPADPNKHLNDRALKPY